MSFDSIRHTLETHLAQLDGGAIDIAWENTSFRPKENRVWVTCDLRQQGRIASIGLNPITATQGVMRLQINTLPDRGTQSLVTAMKVLCDHFPMAMSLVGTQSTVFITQHTHSPTRLKGRYIETTLEIGWRAYRH